ncbi:hypothetical protein [Chelatococcus reniformis]|jgi:hypothetical protein|uniref:Uncharacterized protein n=1 Tax=Chelatococcus reniformis TaxID=1494448 RepID=A0A916U2F9_9HYPH|nr:hypothetical protein [Chelatococcus reniformis]GGC56759.1 hypothetical protein GCM10010994_14610 [Chelatococcus reniformis]
MAVDGTWNITMQTPMGERSSSITLASDGGALTGTQAAEGNSTEIFDGAVAGDEASWKIKIDNPMPLTLEFKGNVEGDTINGTVSAGFVGSWPFSGSRG